jgi:hypothetical protein
MDFDFHTLYSGYSTQELLQIVASPDQFQPGAVQAARDILASRPEAEIRAAEAALQQADEKAELHESPGPGQSHIFYDEDDLPAESRQTAWYRWIIVIAIGVLIAYSVYEHILMLWYLRDPYIFFRSLNAIIDSALLGIGILALTFFLQGARWGWVLMTGYVTYMWLSCILALIAYIYYLNIPRFGYSLMLLMLYSGVLYLLWLPGIKRRYDVDRETASHTVIIAAIATACTVLAAFMVMRHF